MQQTPRLRCVPGQNWLRGLFGVGALVAASLSAGHARAQADILPPAPNVLLLVDTSGSMDYKTNSNSFPTCHYAGAITTAATSERSRWVDLIEVLTGSISNYDCQRLDRNSSLFKNEYSLGGVDPYDFLYPNPYNRPSSNGCVAGPGTLDPANKALFPATAIKFHPFDNTLGTCTNFTQANDGVLDNFSNDVRFGLMTFDTEPRPDKDMNGLWSYYISSPAQGEPSGCNTMQQQEVGVRNTDAPPWEGRAVGFGNPATGSSDYTSRNAMIQKVLLATRPFGATPIAGMLADARTYMLNDTNPDPLDSSFGFGPVNDPAKACRGKSIILLSDGQPNLDLRPFCEPGGGVCPYDKAEDIAQNLKASGIEVFVIGFALSSPIVNGSPLPCSKFTANDLNEAYPSGACAANHGDQAIQACCSLNRIAAAGGHVPLNDEDADWTRAHFADDRDGLRTELSLAISSQLGHTSRTPFVSASSSGFVPQGTDPLFARAFRFGASLQPGKLRPWVGEVDRARYTCTANPVSGVLEPNLQAPAPEKGDMFVTNVNASGPSARKIYTVVPDSPVVADATMRPNLAAGVTDGVGIYKGTMSATARSSAQFVADVPPAALNVPNASCTLTGAQCRDRYLNWLVGIDGTSVSRCPSVTTGKCDLVADVLHSTPRAVPGRPSQFLVDSSYQKFVTDQLTAKRPSVLYASSNDGFLHAFKIIQVDPKDSSEPMQVKTKETNELWTFVPPGVLPNVPSLYPSTHQLLLDGTPAIKEVVGTANPTGTNYKFLLERTRDQARGGTGEWRTILVQSFGSKHPGYFAIDITDPVPSANGVGGPKFLWQLAGDAAGNALFGSGGGTPLITTVFLGGKEIAVAVLPGGYGSPGTGGPSPSNGCNRAKTDWTASSPAGGAEVLSPRTIVPCYTDTSIAARSLTVVRLDSGEILRTFRQAEGDVPGLVGKGVFTQAFIDAPMTGQPVAYPADVGAVADRVFIGDQDGSLWRLNLASDTGIASDWRVELFFDGYPKDGTFSHSWKDGQPIINTPIISVNQVGNLTINFSTGDQEAVGSAPGLANYVWSLTELPSADRATLSAKVNWHLDLKSSLSGDRVIGEMSLFQGDLFFTTVGPGSGDACGSGSAKVWGMNYINPNPLGTGRGGAVSASFTAAYTGGADYISASTLLGGTNPQAFLSGASVAQAPSCDSPGASTDDGFFSYGSQPGSSNVTPGKYQLIIPTGDKGTTSTTAGLSQMNLGNQKGVAIDLKQPVVTLFVDSWASIVE